MPSIHYTLQALLLLPVLTPAISFDCKRIVANKQSFDLSALGGPKTVHLIEPEPPSVDNTTFTLDICKNLAKAKEEDDQDDCPAGTRVCAKKRVFHGSDSVLAAVIPIAGEYSLSSGRSLNPKFTRLKDSVSNSDAEKEGLIMELHGGQYNDVDQKAIIEFVCDKEHTGNEGFESSAQSSAAKPLMLSRTADDSDAKPSPLPNPDEGKALQLLSYKQESGVGVLRLHWLTKYACEDAKDVEDPSDGGGSSGSSSSGWGFFTWLIIVVFLLAAAYIIFGSWLNYNRYGARGWDLIPHGDTIRDIPYIIKDWCIGLSERLRGDHRGGYSAV